jgi:hypothetical protein
LPADILPANAPALSATSDMPSAAPVDPAATVVTEPVADPAATPNVDPAVTPAPTPATPAAPVREPIGVRLSEITRQRREAEERAQRLENLVTQQGEQLTRALEAITKIGTATQAPAPTTTQDISARPTRDSYADPESYEAALVTWASSEAASRAAAEMERRQAEAEEARAEAARVAEANRVEQARLDTERRQADALKTSWETKREAALIKYEDFIEVAESPNVPISDAMALVIMNSDDGAEIAYYLGKHPDEAAKIAGMVIPGQVYPPGTPRAGLPMSDGIKQAVAMGRLATKLGLEAPVTVAVTNSLVAPATATPAPASTTAAIPVTPAVATPPAVVLAPAPPNPISGSNANATTRSLAEVGNEGTMEEYAARRTPEILAARRPGGRALH